MFKATAKLSQSGSRHLDNAYLQTTATPTGMHSLKLGQVTKYLHVIGLQELCRLCSVYIVACQTYRQTDCITSLPPAGEVTTKLVIEYVDKTISKKVTASVEMSTRLHYK